MKILTVSEMLEKRLSEIIGHNPSPEDVSSIMELFGYESKGGNYVKGEYQEKHLTQCDCMYCEVW